MPGTTIYVDADSGSDANGGTGWGDAKEHISAALSILTFPLTDETVILLKDGCSAKYEESSGYIDLSNILCEPGGNLTIMVNGWNDSNYENGSHPFTGATPMYSEFDADRPAYISVMMIVGAVAS